MRPPPKNTAKTGSVTTSLTKVQTSGTLIGKIAMPVPEALKRKNERPNMTPAFIPTGEVRKPRKGDWCLDASGAVREAIGSHRVPAAIYARTDALELACKVAFAEMWLAHARWQRSGCWGFTREQVSDIDYALIQMQVRYANGPPSHELLAAMNALTTTMKGATDGK